MKTGSSVNPALEDKAKQILAKLRELRTDRSASIFPKALESLQNIPKDISEQLKEDIVAEFCRAFAIERIELPGIIHGRKAGEVGAAGQFIVDGGEAKLDALLPKQGFLRDYVEYTRKVEAPMIYHVLCGLALGGCALGRRVSFDMGFFKIYPPLAIMLVGPPGKVKKTTSIDIALNFIRELNLAPIMPNKMTPEALVDSLMTTGEQVIPAGELSVLFGRQKYNEGLMPIMLSLLDSPDSVKVKTMLRGETILSDIGITLFGGSTPSLLLSAAPTETTSSGFLSRFLVAFQPFTERCFPIPSRGPDALRQQITRRLMRSQDYVGALHFSREAEQFFNAWYYNLHKLLNDVDDESISETISRTPSHVLRLSIILSILDSDTTEISPETLKASIDIVDYLQQHLAGLLGNFKTNRDRAEVAVIMNTLARLGNSAEHAILLRKSGLTARQFNEAIKTLIESRRVEKTVHGFGVTYNLLEIPHV